MEYEFDNGISAMVQGGYNKMEANWLGEQGLTALVRNISNDPQLQDDISVEARLRWLVGLNYYEQDFATAGTGGRAVLPCWDSLPFNPATGDVCNAQGTLVTGNNI